jgi:hypothetical protein
MFRSFVVCAALAASSAALGQSPAAPQSDKPAETFNEVERGFYAGTLVGPFFIMNAPAASTSPRPFAPGQVGGLEVGYDFGAFASAGLFLLGTANRAGSEYKGYSATGSYSGDFAALIPGAAARINFFALADANQTRRTFLYVRAGAGYALFSPRQLLPTPDILVFAGPGVEYYTRLRHFSIGVELTGTFLVSSQAFGFALTPSLRYAF